MNKLQANICLLCVTMIWSAEVTILAYMPEEVSPAAISCMTNLIGAALLFMCFFRRIKAEIARAGRRIVIRCALLAVLYFVYNLMYIYGWQSFDVLTGDFTISLTVAFMPVLMLMMRQKIGVRMLVSSALVLTGVIISLLNNEGDFGTKALLIILAASFLRGLFYIKLNETAKEYDSITLAALIILFSGTTSYIAWTAVQPVTFFAIPWSKQIIASLFVHAYFVTMTAQTLNIFAQKRTDAASATIIYAMDSVFATLWCLILPASIVGGVTITPARIAAVVFVILGNLTDIIRRPGEKAESGEAGGIEMAGGIEEAAGAEMSGKGEETGKPGQNPVPGERLRPHIDVMDTGPKQKALIILVLFIVYFIISIPFKALDIMPGFTDIRPVTVLQPVYGIFFGIPGCVVLSLGNVVSDIIGGSLRLSSVAGAAANFVGPFLFYIYWAKISKTAFDLRSWRNILRFTGTVIAVAAVEVLMITPAVAYFYPDIEYMRFAVIVFCNTVLFPVAFGVPLLILIQEEFGFMPIRIPGKYEHLTA